MNAVERCPYDTDMMHTPVDWGRVDCVMLDMDGVVLDLAFDDYYWGTLLPQRYAQHHGLDAAAARQRLAPIFETEYGSLNWYCLDFWSRRTGLDMAAMKREIRGRISPLPGSIAFLDAVRASGRRLWLVTNAHADSWQLKMAQTGLADRFEHIICSHDYGAAKEQAAFWPRLHARHAFDPARCLFVDDGVKVLAAARAYGIGQVLTIRRPNSALPPRDAQALNGLPAIDGLGNLLPLPH